MGHIRLSREHDAVLVAPASADILAKMAQGLCSDLATTLLLASDKPVFVAPAMNHRMWDHVATQRNVAQLVSDGVQCIGPDSGALACGEEGAGRMAELSDILAALDAHFVLTRPLAGLKALVTAGPSHEAIDPVRYIANRSSGKQGYAIAEALADAGADVTLISGPTSLAAPDGVSRVDVESAADMLAACEAALPADIAICAAAVADWRVSDAPTQKMKKQEGKTVGAMTLTLEQNPDILATISQHIKRPSLVVGFAAETENLIAHAKEKLLKKGCDWIVANDVAAAPTFGADENTVALVTREGAEHWERMRKSAVARALAARIANHFNTHHTHMRSEASHG